MKYPIKVLLDEKKQPFLPFTTTECVLVDGTDQTMTEYLNAFITEKDQDIQDIIDELEQYTEQRMVELDNIIQEATQLKNDAANGLFDGEDGITPTIGTNGNWHLGRQDTGLPSRGERGPIGPQGIQGPKGDPGEKGDPGSGGTNVTYEFAMTTELPDLDYTVEESYEVELNADDILQLEEFVNAYAKEKNILNVSVDGVVLWSFSNLLANIEMLDETRFTLNLENRFVENINLSINGTFDGTDYTVTDSMLILTMGDLDFIYNKLEKLEEKGNVVKVFTGSSFQPKEQPTGIYFMSDDTGTVEGSSGSGIIRAGTLYVVANDDKYQSKLAFEAINSSITSIEGNIKTLSGGVNKTFYVRFSDFMKVGSTASIYAKHTYTTLPESSKVPTTDNQFVNKKYVDDAIASAITNVLEGEY